MSIHFRSAALVFSAGVLLATAAAAETSLVMFEEEGCVWCARWNAEIAPAYPKTDEGKRAPLERVDVSEAGDTGYALVREPFFTPTFVLVNDGTEVGRIEGYPGQDFFWPLLAELIAKLPADATPAVMAPSHLTPDVTPNADSGGS